MIKDIMRISPEALIGQAAGMKIGGFRFVTMTCAALDEENVDILYHFDKDLEMKHFRLTTEKDKAVPSISKVYLAAFLVENEIQDLFGVRFDGLIIDYKRTLYLEGEKAPVPFGQHTEKRAENEQNQAPQTAD